MSPEVFNIWCKTVEVGETSDIDQKLYWIAIVRLRNEFQLCLSNCKKSFNDQIIVVKDAHQLADEDPCKKKDPDYIPDDDNDFLD